MFNCKLYNIPYYSDERGILSVLENGEGMPFKMERVFWITEAERGEGRGKHSHRTCSELLVAASGEFKVDVRDDKNHDLYKTFVLSADKHEALLIPPATWCGLYDFRPASVCLCLASEPYDAAGYITD